MEKPLTYRHDYEDGSYNVWYRPPITGQYLLHILYCDGEHLPNSPYIVNIGRMSYAFDPTKVFYRYFHLSVKNELNNFYALKEGFLSCCAIIVRIKGI